MKLCRELVGRYLRRPWTESDGLSKDEIEKAEARLGVALPPAMRSFYLSVGAVAQLCSIHNVIFHPKDLVFEDAYLMFMDENQSVVSWGIKRKDLKKADPEAWQRNNSSGEWYSEEQSFIECLTSLFDWYEELGVFKRQTMPGASESLYAAILDDDRAKVKALLENGPCLHQRCVAGDRHEPGIAHWIYSGDTLLHVAAAGYRVEIATMLLAAGAGSPRQRTVVAVSLCTTPPMAISTVRHGIPDAKSR